MRGSNIAVCRLTTLLKPLGGLSPCRIMRNLSLPVVWEDADMPEEWERDSSTIPQALSKGRYVFWAWTHGSVEKHAMPFEGSTSQWPGVNNLTELLLAPAADLGSQCGLWTHNITPPSSMGMLFRDPSTYELFQQGNTPFRAQMDQAGIQPTTQWPAMLYGTLPEAWGQVQPDTSLVTFPELAVM